METAVKEANEVQGPALPEPPEAPKARKPGWVRVGIGIMAAVAVALPAGIAIGSSNSDPAPVASGAEAPAIASSTTGPDMGYAPTEDVPWTGGYGEDGDEQEIEQPVIEADAPEITEPEFTASQENAISTAESYLDYTAFSKSGLIEQLEYEKYSAADARFAVNHINVDWNEQAAKSAKSYLEYSSFSRQGLIDQLEYAGFTTQQATYGVNTTGL
jgi:hypothetical protein